MLDITLQETRVYQEAKEMGLQEGRQEGAAELAIRLLTKKFGIMDAAIRDSITQKPLASLNALAEAILDFSSLDDLQDWLNRN